MGSNKGYALFDVILGIAILIPICSASTFALLHIKQTISHAQDNWTLHPKIPAITYKTSPHTTPQIKKIEIKKNKYLYYID